MGTCTPILLGSLETGSPKTLKNRCEMKKSRIKELHSVSLGLFPSPIWFFVRLLSLPHPPVIIFGPLMLSSPSPASTTAAVWCGAGIRGPRKSVSNPFLGQSKRHSSLQGSSWKAWLGRWGFLRCVDRETLFYTITWAFHPLTLAP